MGESEREIHAGEKISLAEFLKRLRVILPLVQGWNPDLLIAVNSEGLILSGFLTAFLNKEVRNVALEEKPFQIIWDNLGNLEGKRAVLVAGRFREGKSREELEKWVKEHGALSVLVMVAVGGRGDYSLFPEWGEEVLLPWEDREVR
ncbi:MAG TPA: hypothetical protein PK016_04325 [Candidatus Atribacteria bacterium]|nr:hypothetical protein [Candidatus Atribacteria bacterium]